MRALPGVGAYTAAAVASIAFGVPVVPVDGNVERVAARVFGIAEPLPGGKGRIAAAAAALGADPAAQARPADFTQALFDLGAAICTPRSPACALCPWRDACQGRLEGDPERLPVKAARRKRPMRFGAQFWLEDAEGRVLLRRRPPEGLLGGMLELPGTGWREERWGEAEAFALAPQAAAWRAAGVASHGFTHFVLEMTVYAARVAAVTPEAIGAGMLYASGSLGDVALPTAMRRCVALARSLAWAGD